MHVKAGHYLQAGAREVWVVTLEGRRTVIQPVGRQRSGGGSGSALQRPFSGVREAAVRTASACR
jgi:hypothetical protein